jgi:hypothetical protein
MVRASWEPNYLKSPEKDFKQATVHVIDRAAGKGNFSPRDKGKAVIWRGILDKAAETINGLGVEPILVVHYKRTARIINIEREVRARAPMANLSFLTWGRHTATNEHRNCKHVILIGLQQYGVPENEALSRAAIGLEAKEDLSAEDLEAMRLGAMRHHLFQAACRGAMRTSVGDGCSPGCHLYVFYSTAKAKGFPLVEYETVFPGATIVHQPKLEMPYEPRGETQKRYVKIIVELGAGGMIQKRELANRLDLDIRNLSRILNHPELNGVLARNGVAIADKDRAMVHVVNWEPEPHRVIKSSIHI